MTTTHIPAGAILLDEHQVIELTQIPERTLRRMVSGGRFPRPIRLGSSARARKRWLRTELEAWLRARCDEREGRDAGSEE